MFLGVDTSPEISYALSFLSRYLTQATLQYDIHTKHLLHFLSRYLTQATLQHGIHAKHLLRYVWAAGIPLYLGALVQSIFHSKQGNSIRFQTRVGLMFYLLANQLIVMLR